MEDRNMRFGFALTSLVLGIIVLGWILCIAAAIGLMAVGGMANLFAVGGVMLALIIVGALIGIVLGVTHISRKGLLKKFAIWGTVLSLIGLLAGGYFGYSFYQAYCGFQKAAGQTGKGDRGEFQEWIGKAAPDITVTDLEGKTRALSTLKGRRVVLDFWATWCPPCRKEIPHFIELRKTVPENELAIIGISNEEAEKLVKFGRDNKVNYPLARADDEKLPKPYADVTGIPTTFFIDRQGIIQDVAVGYRSLEDLKAKALGPDWAATEKKK
ncbi:MAG: redoxin domain-containing protein [Candidatus Aureabacteria bacterium]|nr:redoxin domain-containing protein [Candidatus Auribacterota bacterium]